MDGIDVCGHRFVQELLIYIQENPVDSISFVGYSLGGLIIRYAIGILYEMGFFDKVEARNYVTFATPHLGVDSKLAYFSKKVLFRTGEQCCLQDDLLFGMSQLDSIFMKGLNLFKKRILVSNVAGDFTVPYLTASIQSESPYKGTPVCLSEYPYIASLQTRNLTCGEVLNDAKRLTLFILWIPVILLFSGPVIYQSQKLTKEAEKRYREIEPNLKKINVSSNEMLCNLNTLDFERVDVYFGRLVHAHAMIVGRISTFEEKAESVIKYVIKLMI